MSLRCAVYARYSTDKQNPVSIQDQVRKCREYAMERDWSLPPEHIYSDEEISGTTMQRPGLRQLVAEAESPTRAFDAILAEDTSRLSRKQADVLNLCERLNFAGVRLCFVSQGIDSTDDKFQLLLTARGMIDQLFLADTSKRVHRGMEGLARKGLHTGGRCYGYRRREDAAGVHLETEPTEAAMVRRIFEMYADCYSLKQIAKKLNAERVPSPQPQLGRIQRSWAPTAVRQMLLNERYVGRTVWNKKRKVRNPATGRRVYRSRPESEWIRTEVPELRIVSDDLWQAVQNRFKEVRSQFGTKSRAGLFTRWSAIGSPYLFSGILRCAPCGANMNIVSGKGKRGYAKYGCPMHHLRNTCSNDLTERSDVLENRLLQELQRAVLQPEVVEYAIDRLEAELEFRFGAMTAELGSLRKRKHVIESEVGRLTQALAAGSGALAPAAVINAINEREEELRSISDRILQGSRDSIQGQLRDVREFVTSKLSDIRTLLYSDVPTAKAEILRHVDRIDLNPMGANGERFFVASGEWNLLGGYDRTKSVGAAGRS